MISKVDTLAWAPADLTGNAALVKIGTDLFIAGGRRENSTQAIYRSVDGGLTWAALGTVAAPVGSMDPAISADGTNIHFVHAVPNAGNPLLTDVVYRLFDTVAGTFGPAIPLLTGSKAQAAYDIVTLAAGSAMVVTAGQEIITPVGHEGKYVLLAFTITALGAVTSEVIQETHWSTGNTVGAVSLVFTGGSAPVELYYTEHPRVFSFRTVAVQINRRTFSSTWTAPVTLTTYGARFTDDKLTVIVGPGGDRLLAQAYHLQSKTYGLQTQLIYGWGTFVPDAGSGTWTWAFADLEADGYSVYREPVIGTDGTSVFLAYLAAQRDPVTGVYSKDWFLRVANVSPTDLSLTTRTGAWASLRFKWLRGGKSTQDTTSRWAVIGIAGNDAGTTGGVATYLSEFNLPPQAVLKPTNLTVQRGTDYILDASETIDPDMDSLTYSWSVSPANAAVHIFPTDGGKKAVLRVDKTIGPALATFTVSVTVDDGVAGHSALPEATATSTVTVPFNAAPTISLASPVAVTRNTQVHVQATITDADADTLEILWTQVSGTPVGLTNTDRQVVTVDAFRMNPAGEAVVLRVTASDGVNTPVTADVTLNISAILDRDLDAGITARAYYGTALDAQSPISQRNNPEGLWHEAVEGTLASDFFKVEVVNNYQGDERFCYTSPKSLLAMSQGDAGAFTRRYYPPTGERLWDATLDDHDRAYLLTNQGRILRYHTDGPGGVSDWPDEALPIGSLVVGRYSGISVLPINASRRVIAVYGQDGIFLLQVLEETLDVMDTLRLDVDSGMLPANQIVFVRFNSVVSLKSGQILVGVVAEDGTTTEVLVDLAQRRAVSSWDRSNLINRVVVTGEILAVQDDTALGRPSAPEWEQPDLVGSGLYNLTWTQRRPDLVVSYEIWVGVNAAPPVLFAAIPSGSIRRAAFPTAPGQTYHLTIRAQGSSGMSAFSAEQIIAT